MNEDINWLLEQWGIWARSDGTEKLNRTDSAMFSGLVPHRKDDACLMITDEQAMRVDYILGALQGFDDMNWTVIMMSYYYNITDGGIVKQFKRRGERTSRPKIQARREAGAAFIAGFKNNRKNILKN